MQDFRQFIFIFLIFLCPKLYYLTTVIICPLDWILLVHIAGTFSRLTCLYESILNPVGLSNDTKVIYRRFHRRSTGDLPRLPDWVVLPDKNILVFWLSQFDGHTPVWRIDTPKNRALFADSVIHITMHFLLKWVKNKYDALFQLNRLHSSHTKRSIHRSAMGLFLWLDFVQLEVKLAHYKF